MPIRHGVPTLVHHRLGLAYWPIPKCAHASMLRWLGHKTAGFVPEFDLDGATIRQLDHVVLVRHPFDRYVSALWQMLGSNKVPDLEWLPYLEGVERYNQAHEGRRLWNAAGDVHFRPQWKRVAKAADPALFAVGDWHSVEGWLTERGVDVSGAPLRHHNRADPGFGAAAGDILNRGLIERYYVDDLNVWDRRIQWQPLSTPTG